MTSKGIGNTLAASSIRQHERQLLNHLTQLQQQQMIIGAALWNLESKTVQTIGEPPTLSLAEMQSGLNQRKNWS